MRSAVFQTGGVLHGDGSFSLKVSIQPVPAGLQSAGSKAI